MYVFMIALSVPRTCLSFKMRVTEQLKILYNVWLCCVDSSDGLHADCGSKCHILCAVKWGSVGQTKPVPAAGSALGQGPSQGSQKEGSASPGEGDTGVFCAGTTDGVSVIELILCLKYIQGNILSTSKISVLSNALRLPRSFHAQLFCCKE